MEGTHGFDLSQNVYTVVAWTYLVEFLAVAKNCRFLTETKCPHYQNKSQGTENFYSYSKYVIFFTYNFLSISCQVAAN